MAGVIVRVVDGEDGRRTLLLLDCGDAVQVLGNYVSIWPRPATCNQYVVIRKIFECTALPDPIEVP